MGDEKSNVYGGVNFKLTLSGIYKPVDVRLGARNHYGSVCWLILKDVAIGCYEERSVPDEFLPSCFVFLNRV